MTCRQDFSGPVEQVVQADEVTINHHQGRPLTKDERRDVNARVREISEKYGDQPWDIWKLIHRSIGVDSVDELTIHHRDQVDTILGLLGDRGQLRQQLSEYQAPTQQPEVEIQPWYADVWQVLVAHPLVIGATFLLGVSTESALVHYIF